MLKEMLGISPQLNEEGAFIPSRFALKVSTSDKTDYDHTLYSSPYQGNKKVLMVCTEQRNMTMKNGKKFSTGNHPVEMLVPMLHLKNAGFDIDIFTPTGESVKIEMWAMPEKDEQVQKIYSEYKNSFENPKSLADFIANDIGTDDGYLAIFIPGGHGAMLGLPDSEDLGKLIHWSHGKGLHMLAICHAPAGLLSANLIDKDKPFIYAGYKMAVFPDSIDKISPKIGYICGKMPWLLESRLKQLGVTIVNKKADNTCHVDRKLITGASPQAANNFGKLSATELLKHY